MFISKLGRYPYIYTQRKKSGFSLVELLVVIAIIGLLVGIILPAMGKAKSIAMRVKCAHNLKQVYIAFSFYLDGNNDGYPCAQDPVNSAAWLWMGRGWRSFVEPYLGTQTGRGSDTILFCPQDQSPKKSKLSGENFDYTSYAYSMSFYHSAEQINKMNAISDTYLNPQDSIIQKRSNVKRPSAKILSGEWSSNHLEVEGDNGWWCLVGKRNFLFADGSVLYLSPDEIRKARDGYPDANLTFDGIRGIDYQP